MDVCGDYMDSSSASYGYVMDNSLDLMDVHDCPWKSTSFHDTSMRVPLFIVYGHSTDSHGRFV